MSEDIGKLARVTCIGLIVLFVLTVGVNVGSMVYLHSFCDKQEQVLTIEDKYKVKSPTRIIPTGKVLVPINGRTSYKVVVAYGGKSYQFDVPEHVFNNKLIGDDINCIAYHSKKSGECVTIWYNSDKLEE